MTGGIERAGEGAVSYTLHHDAAPVGLQWYFRTETNLPVAVQRWTCPPGSGEGVHAHPPGEDDAAGLEELYVLVRGRATMLLGGREVAMGPGDALLAPPDLEHGVATVGPEPAEFLVVFGPPSGGLDWRAFGTGRAAAAADGPA